MKENKKRRNCSAPQLLDPKTNDWEVGFLMAKYSYKCKKQIVKEYVKGNGSDYVLAQKYGVPSDGQYVSGLLLIKNGAMMD